MKESEQILWENDPTVFRNKPGWSASVERGVFAYHKSSGNSPDKAFPLAIDAEKRARYQAYLDANK